MPSDAFTPIFGEQRGAVTAPRPLAVISLLLSTPLMPDITTEALAEHLLNHGELARERAQIIRRLGEEGWELAHPCLLEDGEAVEGYVDIALYFTKAFVTAAEAIADAQTLIPAAACEHDTWELGWDWAPATQQVAWWSRVDEARP